MTAEFITKKEELKKPNVKKAAREAQTVTTGDIFNPDTQTYTHISYTSRTFSVH